MPPNVLSMQQRCVRCEQHKDLKDFQPSRRGKTGAWCRECYNVDQRKRRGKIYATDPSLPKASAVVAGCSVNGCAYIGTLLRGMCRKHYALWQKQNTKVSWLTETGGMVCSRCRQDKPLSEFYKDRAAKSGYRARCKPCRVLDQKEWRARNIETARVREREYRRINPPIYNSEYRKQAYLKNGRNWALMSQFGITEDEYDELFKAQGDGCAICGRPDNTHKDRRMPVDHDHNTGRRRGILCGNCNAGVGMFDDDPDRLLSAAAYLLQYRDVLTM